MSRSLRVPRARWLVHALIVGTVLVMACGWVGRQPADAHAHRAGRCSNRQPVAREQARARRLAPALPEPLAQPVAGRRGDSYTVAEGDTLATIAEKFYGDSALWRRIYDANRSTIGDNPDNVRIGTTLRIPPKP